MIELFLQRAEDLEVELSVRTPTELASLLTARAVDVAIGPTSVVPDAGLIVKPFLKYELVAVVSPDHRLAIGPVPARALREQVWLLPPSASNPEDVAGQLLRRLGVPEQSQRIFQSHAAAVDEAKRGNGVALALNYPISADLAGGRLIAVRTPALSGAGTWSTYTLAEHAVAPVVAELTRFMTSPRAIQAMLRGSGVNVGHFRPSIHVTLWG
jgi:DNA-binding transcriptional LysR family regulator